MAETLFERFGGQEGIADVVESFYQKVLGDPAINHFFAKTDMAAQKKHQAAFLSHAFGGQEYDGRSMAEAHAGMNLQPQHFDAVAGHLAASLRERGMAQGDIDAAVGKLETLRSSVLGK